MDYIFLFWGFRRLLVDTLLFQVSCANLILRGALSCQWHIQQTSCFLDGCLLKKDKPESSAFLNRFGSTPNAKHISLSAGAFRALPLLFRHFILSWKTKTALHHVQLILKNVLPSTVELYLRVLHLKEI